MSPWRSRRSCRAGPGREGDQAAEREHREHEPGRRVGRAPQQAHDRRRGDGQPDRQRRAEQDEIAHGGGVERGQLGHAAGADQRGKAREQHDGGLVGNAADLGRHPERQRVERDLGRAGQGL
jgi:hypothetical protein